MNQMEKTQPINTTRRKERVTWTALASYPICTVNSGDLFSMASILGNISKTTPHRPILPSSRPRRFHVCLCRLPTKPSKARLPASIVKLYKDALEGGKGLRECLSPKQKGDWKDLVLMSLSFAVYIYVSQQIVCTYCAWISMLNHT